MGQDLLATHSKPVPSSEMYSGNGITHGAQLIPAEFYIFSRNPDIFVLSGSTVFKLLPGYMDLAVESRSILLFFTTV